MKNNVLINDLGPHLLTDYTSHRPISSWGSWLMGLTLWAATLAILCWISLAVAQAEATPSDPLVMKVYPDGTKVVLRWSEVGKQVDNGEKFGGAPRIVAYDPAKDGVVPIGEPNPKDQPSSSNSSIPSPSAVVSPDQPAKMDYSKTDPDTYQENPFTPKEGFSLRASAGPAWTSAIKFQSGGEINYNVQLVSNPGIRFDCAPGYNFNEYVRFEVEGAFIYNKGHRATVSGGDIDGNITAYENNRFGFSGSGIIQVPIIPQLAFSIPIENSPVRPAFGGGFGPNWVSATIEGVDFGDGPVNAYSSSWNCAWQAFAGVDINLAEGIDLSLSYKALGTINPNINSAGPAQSFYTQSANIGLTCRF